MRFEVKTRFLGKTHSWGGQKSMVGALAKARDLHADGVEIWIERDGIRVADEPLIKLIVYPDE